MKEEVNIEHQATESFICFKQILKNDRSITLIILTLFENDKKSFDTYSEPIGKIEVGQLCDLISSQAEGIIVGIVAPDDRRSYFTSDEELFLSKCKTLFSSKKIEIKDCIKFSVWGYVSEMEQQFL